MLCRRWHDVGYQLFVASTIFTSDNDTRLYVWMLVQDRDNFIWFDAMPSNFDLIIAPSHEHNLAIGQVAAQIAGLIEACIGIATEGGLDEPLMCEVRPVEAAASHAASSNVQFARFSNGNVLQMFIQNIDLSIVDGTPDRECASSGGAVGQRKHTPGRGYDGRLGRTIVIDQ